MAYFEFPNTRNYDGDLGYIIKTLDALVKKYNTFFDYNSIKFADPIEWDITSQYPAFTIVFDTDAGTSYISKQPVPAGITLDNNNYWSFVGPLIVDGEARTEIERILRFIANIYDNNDNTDTPRAVGEFLIWKGGLYKVIAAMNIGDSYIVDTNIEATTIEDMISEIVPPTDTVLDNTSLRPIANKAVADAIDGIVALLTALQSQLNYAQSDILNLDTRVTNNTNAITQNAEDINSEAATRAAADSVLSNRITAIGTLPAGSTAGDAELMDIRTAYDGTTYPNAGQAVRAQCSGLNTNIKNVKVETDLTLLMSSNWKQGTIQSDGSISSAHTSDNIYLDEIIDYGVKYNLGTDMYIYIAKYLNGNFVARSAASGGVINPDGVTFNSFKIMVLYGGSATGTRTVSQVLNDIKFINNINLANKFDNMDFIANAIYSQTGEKVCHYSVDDSYRVIKNLTDNAAIYTSIFDEPTLAELKDIHDTTGLCITLNTFNTVSTVPSYSIANVPNKAAYRSDFQANKDWLKFAFHGGNDNSNYTAVGSISADYDLFVASIYTLTGDYDCIDRFTRLGYFGGCSQAIDILKSKPQAIIGLLGADDIGRDSYYLTSTQNQILQSKGMWLDTFKKMVFLKTISRGGYVTMEAEIEANPLYQKYVECFSHEDEAGWLGTCRTMANYLNDNGYTFRFPSLLFK